MSKQFYLPKPLHNHFICIRNFQYKVDKHFMYQILELLHKYSPTVSTEYQNNNPVAPVNTH
jgi:hypothetical protein